MEWYRIRISRRSNVLGSVSFGFTKYGEKGLLCGVDRLPHLIADGRPSHAGEFVIPAFGFLYIAG